MNGANPFPGLRAFDEDDAECFFGRESEVDELLMRLSGNRFLAVTGASGCGKTSLTRAGLLPALRGGLDILPTGHHDVCRQVAHWNRIGMCPKMCPNEVRTRSSGSQRQPRDQRKTGLKSTISGPFCDSWQP
jgi:hypothetical protein